MSQDVRIDSLTDLGTYQFVYSDKHNVFFFFLGQATQKLYFVTTDKYLTIQAVQEVTTPEEDTVKNLRHLKFFRPFNHHEGYLFLGVIVDQSGKAHKFSIKHANMVYEEEIEYRSENHAALNALSCAKDIEVVNYIQKRNRIHVVGYELQDNGVRDPVYGVIDLEQDKFLTIYYLYSDIGDICPVSLNVDADEMKVYVVGSIQTKVKDSVEQLPYLETFMLKKFN